MHQKFRSGTVVSEMRAEMARQGISHTWLASTIGISRVSLTRKLNGNRPLFLPEAVAIADALGTPLSEFLRRAEQVTAA